MVFCKRIELIFVLNLPQIETILFSSRFVVLQVCKFIPIPCFFD